MSSLGPHATLLGVELPATAANDDRGPAPLREERRDEPASPSRGWDAFEVWRTRVRDARRDAQPPHLA